MQFLHHRLSTSTNARWIKKLELGDFEGLTEGADMPTLAEAPLEDLEALGESLLAQTRDREARGESLLPVNPNLPSVMPALPTMFTEDNRLNLPAQADLMRELVGQGIQGFVIMGTTGESSLVSFEEHQAAVAHAVQTARKIEAETGQSISIVAGSGANWTAEQHHLSRTAIESGAQANLLLPPYYIREQSPGNMLRHFWEALDEGPGIVYRVQARSGRAVPSEIIEQLMLHPNFLGIKECDGQVRDLARMFENSDRNLRVWSGEDGEVVRDRSQGAYGSISVTANMHPELVLTANDIDQTTYAADRTAERITALLFHSQIGSPSLVHSAREMQRDPELMRGFRAPCRAILNAQRAWLISGLHQVGVTGLRNFEDDRAINFLRHLEND